MHAFLTGSRAHGTSKPDSDIDLVIFGDKELQNVLCLLSDTGKLPIKFGRLNIIIATTPEEWAAWKLGTLKAQKAHSVDPSLERDDLMICYEAARKQFGIQYKEGDSGE